MPLFHFADCCDLEYMLRRVYFIIEEKHKGIITNNFQYTYKTKKKRKNGKKEKRKRRMTTRTNLIAIQTKMKKK